MRQNYKQTIGLILILFLLSACATSLDLYTARFANIYNDAVKTSKVKSLIIAGNSEEVDTKVMGQLKVIGYSKILFIHPKDEFIVFTKDIPLPQAMVIGEPNAYRIIIKYVDMNDGNIKVEIVRGTQMIALVGEVDKDIEKLVELLKK